MATLNQIIANRRNAQLSTGPRTPEGLAAVRFNALRHGLAAKTAVLENENHEDFDELAETFRAEYQPLTPTENLLVDQMIMAAWRLARLRGIETGLFDLRMTDLTARMQKDFTCLEPNGRRAMAFLDDTRGARAIENLFRYETRIERSFYRALHELQRLRSAPDRQQPPDLPSEPDAPPAPPENSAEQTQLDGPAPQAQSPERYTLSSAYAPELRTAHAPRASRLDGARSHRFVRFGRRGAVCNRRAPGRAITAASSACAVSSTLWRTARPAVPPRSTSAEPHRRPA